MPCKESEWTTSLVVQQMRIYLPMLGTHVRSLVWEEPTCHEAAGPSSPHPTAHALQQGKHGHEKPMRRSWRVDPEHCN